MSSGIRIHALARRRRGAVARRARHAGLDPDQLRRPEAALHHAQPPRLHPPHRPGAGRRPVLACWSGVGSSSRWRTTPARCCLRRTTPSPAARWRWWWGRCSTASPPASSTPSPARAGRLWRMTSMRRSATRRPAAPGCANWTLPASAYDGGAGRRSERLRLRDFPGADAWAQGVGGTAAPSPASCPGRRRPGGDLPRPELRPQELAPPASTARPAAAREGREPPGLL